MRNLRSGFRVGIAVAIGLLLVAYTVLVVTGHVPADRRIDTTHLIIILVGVLCCVVLFYPSLLDRVRRLELTGIKIELLERMQEKQIRQERELDDIRLIIPLLFRDAERKHLSNLARGKTAGYHGGGALREELRKLCSIGLLARRGDHHIGELRSDLVFDLATYVEFTPLGRRWAERLTQLEDAASEVAAPGEATKEPQPPK
jgi:hypothetical protein